MQTRRLGSTGPHITTIGFGAWALGGPSKFGWGAVDDDESITAIRHAIDRGVNWVDTAAFYGRGHSEEVVGRAVAPWSGSEDVLVATKCGLRWESDDPDEPPQNNLRPDSIRYECEQSLKRLDVDRIDLYQFHWPDETNTPVEDSWQTMVELVDEGKVRWIGVSNFDVELLDRCEAIRHVDSLQPPLSLIDTAALKEVIPWCRDHDTGVVVYSPMASGLLTGRFDRQRAESLPEGDWRRTAPAFNEPELSQNLALVERLKVIAERLETNLPSVAVGWTLAMPGVTAAIVGARRPDQVDGWLPAADLHLSEQDLAEIESLLEEQVQQQS